MASKRWFFTGSVLGYGLYVTDVYVCDFINEVPGVAFMDFLSLENVQLSSSVKNLGTGSFMNCLKLDDNDFHNISQYIENIGIAVFNGCDSLENVVIPANVTVDNDAFSYSGVTSVAFEEGATTVPAYALENCPELISITLPATITTIEENSFYGVSENVTIYVPNATVKALVEAEVGNTYSVVIK